MSLEKLSTPAHWSPRWSHSQLALTVVFAVSLFLSQSPYGLALAPLDPIAGTPAQDEALYAHGIARMAHGGDWLTPRFLGRALIVKPPLLAWLSAAALRTFGRHLWALRLPSALAAAGVLLLVYQATGPVGWLLLATCALWRERVGLAMMDDLLTLLYMAAVAWLARDRKLEGRGAAWVFGALVGAAVMTKWFAGFLPLAMLLWARPPWRRWVEVGVAVAIIATPWHAYQLLVNRDWFLAEYLGVELFGYALNAPTQASQEGHLAFYAVRTLYLLPLAAPLLVRRWNDAWLVWCSVVVCGILAYSYQNATYLVPLAPALLLCHRGWIHWGFVPLAMLGWLWLVPPGVPPSEQSLIDNRYAGREVLHLDPDDQLRTSLSPGATVRYVFLIAHLPPNGPLDFERLGVAKPVDLFLVAPEAKVDAVLASDLEALRRLIEQSPQRDFVLPRKVWAALAMTSSHEVLRDGKVWLKSRVPLPGPRPNQFGLLDGPGFAK